MIGEQNPAQRIQAAAYGHEVYSSQSQLAPFVDGATRSFMKTGSSLQEKEDGWPKLLDIYFEDNQTIAYSFEEAITIEKTGMYYLWFVICDEYLSAATVRGQTTWKNPMGYLPGMMYPHIKFFGVMSLLYMTLAIGWMLLYARHWQVRHA